MINRTQLLRKVEDSLSTIRPYLEADGGDIKVVEITDKLVLKLKLLGNCDGCRMSEMTMKAGVEETIKKAVPEITGVEAV